MQLKFSGLRKYFELTTIFTVLALDGSTKALAADATGWSEIPLAGETRCADGSPYSIFVHQGTSGKLVLDFMGGGACWNAETCKEGSIYFRKKIPDIIGSWLPESDGIYDRTNPNNPFRNDTHVMIPYCTGDVHWGSADVTYEKANGEKTKISHRGATNAKAAIDHTLANLATGPSRIFVTGCSAGSYGSIWWTPYVKQLSPQSKIIQFGDSGAGIFTDSFRDHGLPKWNIKEAAPRWIPGLNPDETDLHQLKSHDIYKSISEAHPDVRLSQYNTLNDVLQRWFYGAMGGNQFLWATQMRANMGIISAASPNFNYYIGPWDGHCILPYKEFYGDQRTHGVGMLFPDWINSLLAESPSSNEPCDGCPEDQP